MKKHELTLNEAIKGMHIKSWEQRINNGKTRVVYVRYTENLETQGE